MRKGSSLVEVVIAIAILAVPIAILLTVIASERPIVDYTTDQMLLSSLASSKMSEIEEEIRLNPTYYQTDKYYGFQYDPGSVDDINLTPWTASIMEGTKYYGFQYDPGSVDDINLTPWTASIMEGTFYKIGYPEYRYQFYLSNTTASGVKAVTLITWRRPTYASAPILKNILYLEVFAGAESY